MCLCGKNNKKYAYTLFKISLILKIIPHKGTDIRKGSIF
jgi:hypothetical protein